MENNNEQTVSVSAGSKQDVKKTTDLKNALNSNVKKTTQSFLKFLTKISETIKEKVNKRSSQNLNPQNRPSTYRRKNYSKLVFIVIGIAIIILSFYLGKTLNAFSNYKDTRPLPSQTKAREILNKSYDFPLVDDAGQTVSKIKYKIVSIELQDSIIVNGQRAQAVKGRTFLILNLEITNNHTQTIEISSRDYVRLSTNGKNEWNAPDIHNDPVQVQAISTKITRLGFPINDADKDLKLQIGEIKGAKQVINLNLEQI